MNWVMKYSTHLLTVFEVCLCAWAAVNLKTLSAIQLAVVGFGIFIVMHEWEEMHLPGGFMEMMGDIIGWDMRGIRPGAQHTSQSMFIALILILPLIFPDSHWLFCGTMIFGIVEGIVHVAGIKLANTAKPYTPGMISGIIMFIYCFAVTAAVYKTESIAVNSWILGLAYFVVWFIAMMQLVISFCRFDRKEFMKAMMSALKK